MIYILWCSVATFSVFIFKQNLNVIVQFLFFYSGRYDENVNVSFEASQNGVVDIIPTSFEFKPNDGITKVEGTILGRSPGHVEITATSRPPSTIEYVVTD